jgi:hypothetical protein
LLGNVQINSSSGTSGQVLTSTGASTAPTWQSSVNITYFQTLASIVALNMASSTLAAQLTFNVPTSTATYLFSFSGIAGANGGMGAGYQTFMTFAYEKGTSASTSGSRNFIGNGLASVALTNSISISAAVNPSNGDFTALAGQRIYTVSTGTSFVAGNYTFSVLFYGFGGGHVRNVAFSALQLTG